MYFIQLLLFTMTILMVWFMRMPFYVYAQTAQPSGFIRMNPTNKGFMDGNGNVFIPTATSSHPFYIKRYFADDPQSGREYLWAFGARGFLNGELCHVPTTALGYTFEEFFSESAQKGLTGYRVWSGGANPGPIPGIEPALGEYYVSDACISENSPSVWKNPQSPPRQLLIPGETFLQNYPTCRYPNFTSQNCGPYAPKLQKSLVTRMLQSAELYGIKVRIVLFAYEQDSDWPQNAYADDFYGADRYGSVATRPEFFTDPEAFEMQKQRVRFFLQVWGDSQAIWSWDIYNELNFAGGGTTAESLSSWITRMAEYVKSLEISRRGFSRPISFSSWEVPEWEYGARTNSAFANPAIDYVDYHAYGVTLLRDWLSQVRQIESTYGKTVVVGEFYPWEEGGATEKSGLYIENTMQVNPPYEQIPYRPTLFLGWNHFIATGTNIPQRWGLDQGHLRDISGMDIYTGAPTLTPIVQFVNSITWSKWDTAQSQAWENYITGTNIDFVSARGDGDQVMVFIHGTEPNVGITIDNLVPGSYIVKQFDVLTGNIISTQTLNSSGNRISMNISVSSSSGTEDAKNFTALLVEEKLTPTPPPTINQLRLLLTNYTSVNDQIYFPRDGKVNMLDAGWMMSKLN